MQERQASVSGDSEQGSRGKNAPRQTKTRLEEKGDHIDSANPTMCDSTQSEITAP